MPFAAESPSATPDAHTETQPAKQEPYAPKTFKGRGHKLIERGLVEMLDQLPSTTVASSPFQSKKTMPVERHRPRVFDNRHAVNALHAALNEKPIPNPPLPALTVLDYLRNRRNRKYLAEAELPAEAIAKNNSSPASPKQVREATKALVEALDKLPYAALPQNNEPITLASALGTIAFAVAGPPSALGCALIMTGQGVKNPNIEIVFDQKGANRSAFPIIQLRHDETIQELIKRISEHEEKQRQNAPHKPPQNIPSTVGNARLMRSYQTPSAKIHSAYLLPDKPPTKGNFTNKLNREDNTTYSGLS